MKTCIYELHLFVTVPETTGGKTYFSVSGTTGAVTYAYRVSTMLANHALEFENWIASQKEGAQYAYKQVGSVARNPRQIRELLKRVK